MENIPDANIVFILIIYLWEISSSCFLLICLFFILSILIIKAVSTGECVGKSMCLQQEVSQFILTLYDGKEDGKQETEEGGIGRQTT